MRKLLFSALTAILLIFSSQLNAQKIVAYYPYYNWGASLSSMQYSKLTDVVYAFITPNSSGYLQTTEFRQNDWNTMRDLAQAAGCKVHISVGGHNLSTTLANVAANASTRATLVSELKKFVEGTHSYNNKKITGVDIDWEFPKTASAIANHLQLIKDLRVAFGSSYEISVAVGGSSRNMGGNYAEYHDDFFDQAMFSEIDYLHCMNYDLAYFTEMGAHNSPLLAAQKVVEQYVTNFGLASNKFVLGVPFYGKGGWADGGDGTAYSSFASSAAYNDADGDYNGHKYNSKPLLESKGNLVCSNNLGGLLIWEITQDANAPYSLVDAMYNYLQANCASLSCTAPDLGADQSLCTDPITLNSNVSAGGGKTFTWYKDNVVMNGETGTTLSITVAGTYKVVVDDNGCVKEDEIVITQSGNLQVTATEAKVCQADGPTTSTINVTGGGGLYNFYDVPTGGTALHTGANYTINASDIPVNQTRTWYAEEPAGQSITFGPTGNLSDGSSWPFIDVNAVVNDNGTDYDQDWTMKFTTYSSVTIQSIDFIFGHTGSGGNDQLEVRILKQSDNSVYASKTISLTNINYSTQSDQYLNTVSIGIDIPDPDNYMISFKGTNTLLWLDRDYFTMPAPAWIYNGQVNGSNVIALTGTGNTDSDYSWNLDGNMIGAYNWKVSTGSGATCGRVGVSITHECPTGVNDILTSNAFKVFPNPATQNANVSFDLASAENVNLTLVNALGETVYTKNLGVLNGGNHNVQVPTNNVENGLYFVKLNVNNNIVTQSVTVVK